MAYDEALAERVRQSLSGHPAISERKMMGGLCFMAGTNMCCSVQGSALIVRVGKAAYPDALNKPHVRPMELGGRRPGGFVLVDPQGYRGRTAFDRWVQIGLDVAASLPAKPPKTKKPRR